MSPSAPQGSEELSPVAVANYVAQADEVSLAELRENFGIQRGGPGDSQLSRILRGLVSDGTVLRVRRGFYHSPLRPIIPAQRIAEPDNTPVPSAGFSGSETSDVTEVNATIDVPVKVDDEDDHATLDVDVDVVSFADPNNVVSVNKVVDADAGVVSSADDAIEPTESVSIEPVEEVVIEPVEDVAIESAESVAEPVECMAIEAAERVTSPVDSSVDAEPVDDPSAGVDLSEVDQAIDRLWLRSAGVGMGWLAVSGLALMVAGTAIGIVIAVLLGAAALVQLRKYSQHRRLLIETWWREQSLDPSTDSVAPQDQFLAMSPANDEPATEARRLQNAA